MRRPLELLEKYKRCKSLADVKLDFVNEWHASKNFGISPADFRPQSNKKVWWKCQQGHSWQAIIQRRFYGDNCPYCTGKKASVENCLRTKNSRLAEEWNYSKNGGLTPDSVLPGSAKKVWWICSVGHEWEARIDHRNNGSGCPQCRLVSKFKK